MTHLEYMAELAVKKLLPELTGVEKRDIAEALNRELFEFMEQHQIEIRYKDEHDATHD